MPQLHPLLNVPTAAFFRTTGNNDKTLYDLRTSAMRTDGFFVVKDESLDDISSTFPLAGAGMSGGWHLGRIIKTPGFECDYRIEIYRRAKLRDGQLTGVVLSCDCLDDHDLAENLRELERDDLDFSYTSKWEYVESDVFTKLGFDLI